MNDRTKAMSSRDKAIETAREWIAERPLYLDTETTGLGAEDEIIEIALLDHDGSIILNTLIEPKEAEIAPVASDITGITAEMMRGAPSILDVIPLLRGLTITRPVMIYNSDFDTRLIAQSVKATGYKARLSEMRTGCVMTLYAQFYGEWNDYHGNYKWQSQVNAIAQLRLSLPDGLKPHRAAADAAMCRLILEAMAKADLEDDEPTLEQIDAQWDIREDWE